MNHKHYRRTLSDSFEESTVEKSGPRENLRGFTTKKLKQLSEDNYHNPDTGTEVDATAVHNELAIRADKKGDKLISQYKQGMKAKPKAKDSPEDWFGKNNTHPWEKVWQNMKDYHTGSVDEKSAPHMHQRAQKYKNYELKEVDLGLISNGEERPHLPLHDETDEKWANNYAKLNTKAPPVTLHPLEGGKYDIVDGRHRARAAALQGKTSVLAYVGIPESGLKKGSMQRIAPVPRNYKPPNPQKVDEWLQGGGDREDVPRETNTNKRMRMLHRLSGQTKVRLTKDGKREFLLHRGEDPNAHNVSLPSRSEPSLNHSSTTSWTPHFDTAYGHARDNVDNYNSDHVVHSAWVHEDKIKNIPFHYGKLDQEYGKFNDMKGPQHFRSEHEVVVDPWHGSELKDSFEVTAHHPYDSPEGSNYEPNRTIDQRINSRVKPVGKTELQKGAKGDWKKESYTMSHTPPKGSGPYSLHTVTAHTHDGKAAGSLSAEDLGDGNFQVHLVDVHPDHRRKGIASAMYQLLEHKTGLKAIPDLEAQSKEGAALWRQKNRKFGKSELSKMSRPRIGFPNYPKVTSRPDQQVSLLETGRQKDIYARGAASQHIKDQKDVPYTTMARKPDGSHEIVSQGKKDMSRQPDREKVATSIANRFDRNVLGLNVNTPTGPRSAALAGKLRSKYEDFDDSHEKRLQEHKEKLAQWRDDHRKKVMEWRNKDVGPEQYVAHMANYPEKGKKPRAPAKRRIATKDLSPEQMALRGKTVDSTIEHEGLHHTMDQISRLYGPEEAARAHDTIYNSFDNTVKGALSQYAQKLGYKPGSEHFQEEMMTAARDILVNPKKRDFFKKLHGDKAEGHLKNLKVQYQKAYEAAKQLKPASAGSKKLAASEEEKKTK
jgi:GNAT superfamily N-acetyltransferase